MKKIRVLMIDDNKQLVDMVKEYFSSHAVIEVNLVAHDGIEGLEAIENHKKEYDLVLLDLIMPKKDGVSVCDISTSWIDRKAKDDIVSYDLMVKSEK